MIVVGAEQTSLRSAVSLARSGVRVRILDKNPEQAHEYAYGVDQETPQALHLVRPDGYMPGGPTASTSWVWRVFACAPLRKRAGKPSPLPHSATQGF